MVNKTLEKIYNIIPEFQLGFRELQFWKHYPINNEWMEGGLWSG